MVTTSITIKKEAYDRLKRMKGSRSFSDLIMALTKKESIMRYAGTLKDADLQSIEDARREMRRESENRYRHLFDD